MSCHFCGTDIPPSKAYEELIEFALPTVINQTQPLMNVQAHSRGLLPFKGL